MSKVRSRNVEQVGFGWQRLPSLNPDHGAVQWAQTVHAAPAPRDYGNWPLAKRFAANMHAALEAQYRILLMLPANLEVMKLQALVARDSVRQAIELGHHLDKQDSARVAEIVATIKQAMDDQGKS